MSEAKDDSVPLKVVSSPPPASQPAQEPESPAAKLKKLAADWRQTRDKKILGEYMRLRRSVARGG